MNFFKSKKEPEQKKGFVYKSMQYAIEAATVKPVITYPCPVLPQGVVPEGVDIMAMDGFCTASQYATLDAQFYSSYLGYPALVELSQSAEYRLVFETFAQEITREWGVVKGDDPEKVTLIEDELKRLNVRDLFRKHVENDFIFGGSQLYLDIEGSEGKTGLPLMIDDKGIKKGSLNGFVVREPIWSTPSLYNANDPLKSDFFVPKQWWMLGKNVHCSRLQTLIMRPVPDMLKPAYNFYGISMIQLMVPYVQRLQSVIDAVAKVITMFSLTGLKTDLGSLISASENGVNIPVARARELGLLRDNTGVLLVDKEGEEIFQINTPLTGLKDLVDAFTQMVAYPSKIPVIKLFGTPTAGLGNTSDGEFRAFYDSVSALQEAHLLPQMKTVLKCIQLNLFGKIDPSIEFKFNPLYQLDDNERADVNLKKAQTAQIYMQEGVMSNDEVREQLNNDEDSGYSLEGDAPEIDPYGDPDASNS